MKLHSISLDDIRRMLQKFSHMSHKTFPLLDRTLVIVFTSQDPNQIMDSCNLFAAFQRANDCQFWNLNLNDALTSCQLMGVIYPSSILIGGPRHQLDIIKTAWAKRLLKPPAYFSIDSVGEFPNGLRTRLVEQSNFLLLSEALCYIIYDLAMSGSEMRVLNEAPVPNRLDHMETTATLEKNVNLDHLAQIRHKSRVKKSRKSRPKTTDCNPNNMEGITSKLPCEFQIAPNNSLGDGSKVNLEKIYNCLNSWYSGLCLPSRESIQQALDELIASGQVYCTDYGYNVMTIDKLRVAQWVLEQQLGVNEKDLNEHDQRKDSYYTANQGPERVKEKCAILTKDQNTQNDLKHTTIFRPQTENTCVCRGDLTNGGFELFPHSSIPQFRKMEGRAGTKVNPNIHPRVRLRRHRRVSRRNPEQLCSFCHNYGQLDSLHNNKVIGSPPCPDIVGSDLSNHRLAPKGITLMHNSTINTDRNFRGEQNDQKNGQVDWISHQLNDVDPTEQQPSRNDNSIDDQLNGKPDNTLTAQTNSDCQTKRPVCKRNPLELNFIPEVNIWREMAPSRVFTNTFDLTEEEKPSCDRFRSHTDDYAIHPEHNDKRHTPKKQVKLLAGDSRDFSHKRIPHVNQEPKVLASNTHPTAQTEHANAAKTHTQECKSGQQESACITKVETSAEISHLPDLTRSLEANRRSITASNCFSYESQGNLLLASKVPCNPNLVDTYSYQWNQIGHELNRHKETVWHSRGHSHPVDLFIQQRSETVDWRGPTNHIWSSFNCDRTALDRSFPDSVRWNNLEKELENDVRESNSDQIPGSSLKAQNFCCIPRRNLGISPSWTRNDLNGTSQHDEGSYPGRQAVMADRQTDTQAQRQEDSCSKSEHNDQEERSLLHSNRDIDTSWHFHLFRYLRNAKVKQDNCHSTVPDIPPPPAFQTN
ncbi:hypothetical protein CRM22_008111 [Opisthorchis felineus]|uniref:Uncharacterized protein n=1 Tax=Opisthorchis felineus TaxID=147828 RepID=A0A4S2LD46_OPIFE|nr:hypothetical protein CRM22_008111 [Opisthorchis felineus]